jgi:hypothetical protein
MTDESPSIIRFTKRDGDWMDEFGCCKLCDGEVPNGHTENCYIWKLEQQITALKKPTQTLTHGCMACEGSGSLMVEDLCRRRKAHYIRHPKLRCPVCKGWGRQTPRST